MHLFLTYPVGVHRIVKTCYPWCLKRLANAGLVQSVVSTVNVLVNGNGGLLSCCVDLCKFFSIFSVSIFPNGSATYILSITFRECKFDNHAAQ